jgi:2-iminobutanoate/2-iminopropanoate deaminase
MESEHMTDRTTVVTSEAPAAIGPYSQAIIAGELVFCSGQIPLDPATGTLVEGDIKAQAQRALENLSALLTASGASLSAVVKTTVFLVSMSDFAAMNEVYGTFFTDKPPARSTVAVAELPRGARFEIEAIALRQQ